MNDNVTTQPPCREHLELALLPLEDAPVECDGMSYLVSAALHAAEIPHALLVGCLIDNQSGSTVLPHVWIRLQCRDATAIIDFRARMWLGDNDDVPHGVFVEEHYPQYGYHSHAELPSLLDCYLLDAMSDGRFSRVSTSVLREACT